MEQKIKLKDDQKPLDIGKIAGTIFGGAGLCMIIGSILLLLDVSIFFNVPPDLPPTQLIPTDDRTLWKINITSEVPGVDYAAQFEVPVYPYYTDTNK